MVKCPDDSKALTAENSGALSCPGCGGAAIAEGVRLAGRRQP